MMATTADEISIKRMSSSERAADALRRYEQKGKKLNDWGKISKSQRDRWVDKAFVVIEEWTK